MSYAKTTWNTGDVITAEKLNHMEDGIGAAQVYSVSESVRFSGSVTTEERDGIYRAPIDCDLSDFPEQIKVIFDGTEYTCERVDDSGLVAYGGYGEAGEPDFSEYPFFVFYGKVTGLVTETAGAHQVEISAVTETVNEDLADVIPVMRLVDRITNSADAVVAYNAGKLLYFTYGDPKSFYIVTGIDNTNNKFISTPSNNLQCNFSGVKMAIFPGQA